MAFMVVSTEWSTFVRCKVDYFLFKAEWELLWYSSGSRDYRSYALILIFKNPPEDSYPSKRKFKSIEIFEVRSDLLLNNAANNLELRIRFCILRK